MMGRSGVATSMSAATTPSRWRLSWARGSRWSGRPERRTRRLGVPCKRSSAGFSGGNEPNPRSRITEWRLTMGRLVATTLAALLLSAMGGVQEPATRTEANTPQGVRVFNTRSVKEPKNATAELVDLHASDHMVTRVMRLAPGATIKEHCHPFFDETFFVHAGSLKMVLDDKEHELRAGDTVIMPAGT